MRWRDRASSWAYRAALVHRDNRLQPIAYVTELALGGRPEKARRRSARQA